MESTYSDPALLAYSDARTEYTRQLCQFIVPAIFKFFTTLLDKSREEVGRETQKILYQFQTFLKEIPDWNMEKVSNEIKRLEYEIGCEYLEDLLTAVFIAHTKILTAIRVSSKKNANVQINVPKTERFLFKVLCEVSNLYWKNTFLFRDDVKNLDKQQNYRQAEGMVAEGVSMAIRALVPVKNILRECVIVNDNDHVEADADEEVAEAAPAAGAEAAPAAEAEAAPAAGADEAMKKQAEHPVVKALLNGVQEGGMQATSEQSDNSAQSTTAVHEEEPVLTIDEKESVQFADYDNVYDGDNSNLMFNPKTGDDIEEGGGLLEISDEPGTALDEFDTLEDDSAPASLSADDFDEL